MQIVLECCDIVKELADVLVNLSNSYMNHDSGLAKKYVTAGGEVVQRQCNLWVQKYNKIAVGGLVVTEPGQLTNGKCIFHINGPVYG